MRSPIALITGGAGFIGTRTAPALLAAGWRVRVLDSLHPQIHGPRASWPTELPRDVDRIRGDVRRVADLRAALDGVDAVLHFCAETGVGQSMDEIARYAEVNVQGTANLFQALRSLRRLPRGILLSSSRAVYGEGRRRCPRCRRTFFPQMRSLDDLRQHRWEIACPECGGPTTTLLSRESDPPAPCSTYGLTKWQQEEMVRFFAGWLGIPWVILRYFNVYGPGQSPRNPYTGVVTLFARRAMAGQAIEVYEDGLPLRDFVHIDDVVRANLAALACLPKGGGTINVGSGEVTSLRGLVDAVERTAARRVRRVFRGRYRVGDIRSCLPDRRTARRLLGLGRCRPLCEGLVSLMEWLSARGDDRPL